MPDRPETVALTVALTSAAFAVVLALVTAAWLPAPAAAARTDEALSASCREWTDGCVVCRRSPEGLACSTPGIACTRGPARCLAP